FQPRVDLRRRDAPFLGQTDDVLVIRDAFRSRELVDDVADRDDLFPLRLADSGLDDVDVEAALLAGDLAHPVLDDPDRAIRGVYGSSRACVSSVTSPASRRFRISPTRWPFRI